MGLTRRRTSDAEEVGLHGHGSFRGGWYADPFGKAAERWWDGGKWTERVRGEPSPGAGRATRGGEVAGASAGLAPSRVWSSRKPVEEETPPPPPPAPLEAGRRDPDEAAPPDPNIATRFPVRLESAAARQLRVVVEGRGRSAPTSAPRFYGRYELRTADGCSGSIIVGARRVLARMASAHGAWILRKSERPGRDLIIESVNGEHMGWYSGRQRRSGGTIALAGGFQAELRRSVFSPWKLWDVDTEELLLEIRAAQLPTAVTVADDLPPRLAASPVIDLMVLTGCTAVILEAMSAPRGLTTSAPPHILSSGGQRTI